MLPHTTTLMGRVRRLPGLMSTDSGMRAYSERQCFNARVQGSSADITKVAMNTFMRDKHDLWKLLLTVHDENVVQAPADQAEEARDCLINSMTGPHLQSLLSVPLKVDVHIVDRWSEAKG